MPKLCFRYFHLILVINLAGLLTACEPSVEEITMVLDSPDGRISVHFLHPATGGLQYLVMYDQDTAILPSRLGLRLNNQENFRELTIAEYPQPEEVTENYLLYHGKQIENEYTANRQIIHAVNAQGNRLDIVFQVSDEGVAFRYFLPDSSSVPRIIEEELTQFSFPENASAWLQPMSVAKSGWEHTNPSYEENYEIDIPVGTASPLGAGWVYPALFNSGDTWVLITESGLDRNYCGTRLASDSPGGVYQVAFPLQEESIFDGSVKPQSSTPFKSPWRVIAVGSLKNIIESNLGNALAEPAIEMNTSDVKPGLASWSWALLKDPSITYDVQKKFIDYAAEMDWAYCLVDVNWDTTIGYERIEELCNYAKSKGVGLLLWYNSAGNWNTTPFHPKDKLLTAEGRASEFARLKEMGISGIKVDFFGGDGQSVIAYYHDIMKDAAEFGLLLNFHGATLPRGWHRTYPNLMTMESVKGFEFITFEQENADLAPTHCTILPFTRNAFDPMDFTPMNLTDIPNIDRRTTTGFELALPTLFLSGIQHIAETSDGMATMPEFVKEYLKGIPVAWDETHFLDGYPGRFIILARRKDSEWFITGINSMNTPYSTNLDLTFTENRSGYLITDGDSTKLIKTDVVLADGSFQVSMKPNGGFIMKLD